MKKLTFILVVAILLAGGAVATMSAPSYAQGYVYAPAPADPYAQPWVGPNTPWVYYNGDWFLNGILYYFFGPQYGWAPYYAYPPTYIVRPGDWYASRWSAWYQGNSQYYQHFQQAYPYWQGHREGQRYDQNFYEQHHSGQGGGWQKGFQGRPAAPAQPQGQRPGPAQVAPQKQGVAPQRQAPAQAAPREEQRQAPARVAPQKQAPAQVAPQRQAPAQAAPQRQAPAQAAPQRQAPAQAAPQRQAPAQKAPEGKPEEEKH
jgi:hypothetical protein